MNATEVHLATGSAVIVTTEDKLDLALIGFRNNLRDRDAWLAPLGLVVAIGTALLTSEFHQKFGLGPAVWEAIFWIGLVGSAIWLALVYYKRPGKAAIHEVIDHIKKAGTR